MDRYSPSLSITHTINIGPESARAVMVLNARGECVKFADVQPAIDAAVEAATKIAKAKLEENERTFDAIGKEYRELRSENDRLKAELAAATKAAHPGMCECETYHGIKADAAKATTSPYEAAETPLPADCRTIHEMPRMTDIEQDARIRRLEHYVVVPCEGTLCDLRADVKAGR